MKYIHVNKIKSRFKILYTIALTILLVTGITPEGKSATSPEITSLEKGAVIVRAARENPKQTEAKIFIQASPETVWGLIENQENFPKFSPQFKNIKVLEKNENSQKIQSSFELCKFLPVFKYVLFLDQKEKYKRIKFNKLEGCFKQLYGDISFQPYKRGTILTYRIYLDPGFFIPSFLSSEASKKNLPEILKAIKYEAENS